LVRSRIRFAALENGADTLGVRVISEELASLDSVSERMEPSNCENKLDVSDEAIDSDELTVSAVVSDTVLDPRKDKELGKEMRYKSEEKRPLLYSEASEMLLACSLSELMTLSDSCRIVMS